MVERRTNPDSVGMADVRRMGAGEFKQFMFLRLNSIDGKLCEHDKKFLRLENRIWWVLGSVVALGIVAILAAVL